MINCIYLENTIGKFRYVQTAMNSLPQLYEQMYPSLQIRFSCLLQVLSPHPYSTPSLIQVSTDLLSFTIDSFAHFRSLYEWNPTVCSLFGLDFFTCHEYFEIHYTVARAGNVHFNGHWVEPAVQVCIDLVGAVILVLDLILGGKHSVFHH